MHLLANSLMGGVCVTLQCSKKGNIVAIQHGIAVF
jgi:hypothetical protein